MSARLPATTALAQVAENHYGVPLQGLAAMISGGKTLVTLRGTRRGGRDAELSLSQALALHGLDGVYALARAEAAGLEGRVMLDNNDADGFFQSLGDLVITGPMRTNVNDFRVILIP